MNTPYVFKKCSKCGRWLVASTFNFHKDKKGKYGLAARCKECKSNYHKKYSKENKEKIAQQKNEYYKENKEHFAEYNKKRYKENKEKITEYIKKYRNTPQGQANRLNTNNKRRQKEEQQGKGITGQQWLEMMQYFDWKCAYSGKSISVKADRSIDHILSLAKGGANEIWNLVPMYKSYNSSKNDTDIKEWYPQQDFYSEDRLNKIKEWCNYAYNKWGRD